MSRAEEKKLARNREELEKEGEARTRRLALRRQEEKRRKELERKRRNIRNSYLAIFWFGLLAAGFVAVAWNWTGFTRWFHALGT